MARRTSVAAIAGLTLIGLTVGFAAGVYRKEIKSRLRRVVYRANTPTAATKQGETIFNRTCASGYCHGPAGVGGGAPRLAGAGLDHLLIENAVKSGITGTGMPGFARELSQSDLNAVLLYVTRLSGTMSVASTAAEPAPVIRELSGEAAKGRDLFSDALRSFGRCSTCHAINGIGVPVAPIAHAPSSAAALRALATPAVATAAKEGERMPALVANRSGDTVTFYDLTSAPPVLRTAESNAVTISSGSGWKHSSALACYSDSDLESILAYLRAMQ